MSAAENPIGVGMLGHGFMGRAHAAGVTDWRELIADPGLELFDDVGPNDIHVSRFLLGAEVSTVTATVAGFVGERDGEAVGVDDAFGAAIEFENGATGTVEASRFCPGRANQMRFEVDGSRGTLAFDLERLNELQVYRSGEGRLSGPRRILVTGPEHPFAQLWWPDGHPIGWEHSFVHQIVHLLRSIRGAEKVAPYGADFEDGYRVAEVCDAIARSAASGARQSLSYREAG
jgi:predicted dehydrogenase